jgi:FHA domain
MSETYRCPKGHASTESDYCDTCGAAIAGSARADATLVPPAAMTVTTPQASGSFELCPVCATPRAGADRFCENDGYDFVTGRHPQLAAHGSSPEATSPESSDAEPAGTRWTAIVEADRAYFDQIDVGGIDFPSTYPRREITLTETEVRIGRRSSGKGADPEIDLSGPPTDPGVSHLHAVLTATPSGWTLADLGSKNGTRINADTRPLPPQTPVQLGDGDRVHLGAWTTITIRSPG